MALYRLEDGRSALIGTPRPIGLEAETWTAITAPFPHPGPVAPIGVKRLPCEVFDRARQLAQQADVDETILFDAAGRVVEGARSNLLWVAKDGDLRSPGPQLGYVAGVALDVVRDRVPDLRQCELTAADLKEASELIAVNAVRGASAIVALDQSPIGDGRPGPWSRRLRTLLV